MSEEDQLEWHRLASAWLAEEAAGRDAGGTSKPERKKQLHRLPAKHHNVSVDYVLEQATGVGLKQFISPEDWRAMHENDPEARVCWA